VNNRVPISEIRQSTVRSLVVGELSGLRKEELRLFLDRLSPAPEEADQQYSRLHRKLQLFFSNAKRGAVHAEELADKTLDRAMHKLAAEPDIEIRDVSAWLYGIARYVLLEFQRRERTDPISTDPPDPAGFGVDDDRELRSLCLERCVERLPPSEYRLLIDYYADRGRKKIDLRRSAAADLNTSAGALRIRVFRIRRNLEPCIRKCVEAGGARR
jgi:DNA-directed RNA polymerase specialized sigma24 family protein